MIVFTQWCSIIDTDNIYIKEIAIPKDGCKYQIRGDKKDGKSCCIGSYKGQSDATKALKAIYQQIREHGTAEAPVFD